MNMKWHERFSQGRKSQTLPGHSWVLAVQETEALSHILLECSKAGQLPRLGKEEGTSVGGGAGHRGAAGGAQGRQLARQGCASRHPGTAKFSCKR